MIFEVGNTLKVLLKYNENDDDSNEFSSNSFVTTCMWLVINMFANDLSLPVEYLNRINVGLNGKPVRIDIFVNYNDEDGVYDTSEIEMIWPHYQNRYCFIYANTKRIPPDDVLRANKTFNSAALLSSIVAFLYFFYILFARGRRTCLDSINRAFVYTVQSQTMASIPSLNRDRHIRSFLGAKFLHNFLLGSLYMSFFATQFTAPTTKPVTDQEIVSYLNHPIETITNFGIGEPCLIELTQGHFMRRGCLIACDVANATVQKHDGIVFLKEEVNFQHIFKVSKNSPHFKTIKQLVRRYFEAGMLDRIFSDIHKDSHKYLEPIQVSGRVKFKDISRTMARALVTGYLLATIALIVEIVYFRCCNQRKSKRRINRNGALACKTIGRARINK